MFAAAFASLVLAQDPAPVTLKTYDVRELVAPVEDMPSRDESTGLSGAVFGDSPGYGLIDLITRLIDHAGWEQESRGISYKDGTLIVRTTADTHMLIDRFLDGLRKANFDHPIEATLAAIPWKDGAYDLPTGALGAAEFAEVEKKLAGAGVLRQRLSLSALNGQRVSGTAGGGATERIVIDVRPIAVPGEKTSLLDLWATGAAGGGEFQSRSLVRVPWDGGYVLALGRAGDDGGYFLIVRDRLSPADVSELTTRGMLLVSDENLAPLQTAIFDTSDLAHEILSYPAPDVTEEDDSPDFIMIEEDDRAYDGDEIVGTIHSSTGGGSWDADESAAITLVDNKVIVTQTGAVIEEIKALLPSLRKTSSAREAVTVRLTYLEMDSAALAAFQTRFKATGFPVYFEEATAGDVVGALAGAKIVDDLSVTGANTQRAHTQVYRKKPTAESYVMEGAVADVRPAVSADGARVTLTLRSKAGRAGSDSLASTDGTFRAPAGGGFVAIAETGKSADGAATHLVMLARVAVQR